MTSDFHTGPVARAGFVQSALTQCMGIPFALSFHMRHFLEHNHLNFAAEPSRSPQNSLNSTREQTIGSTSDVTFFRVLEFLVPTMALTLRHEREDK